MTARIVGDEEARRLPSRVRRNAARKTMSRSRLPKSALAYAIEQKPEYLAAAKAWTLAAIDYEPWGYTYNKPNTDLAAGHLLYAIGWAYDLLYDDFTAAERARIRASLERHAGLVYDAFAPTTQDDRFNFTQNHDFIPTAGLAITALALMGESKDAESWAVLARAHHHRAGQLLSPDGYYYEGFEYWIFSSPWLVHFLDAWEHATGESLWDRDVFRNWKTYLAHALLPDGQSVFDFGDIWEGALTRAKTGAEYRARLSRRHAPEQLQRDVPGSGAVEGSAGAGGCRTLCLVRSQQPGGILDAALARSVARSPRRWTRSLLTHHFKDSGVVYMRSSWDEGRDGDRVQGRAARGSSNRGAPAEDSGMAARQRPCASRCRQFHRVGTRPLPDRRYRLRGPALGAQSQHDDVWQRQARALRPSTTCGGRWITPALDGIRIREAEISGGRARIVADLAAAYPKSGRRHQFHAHLRLGRRIDDHGRRCRDARGAKERRMASAVGHTVRGQWQSLPQRPRR